MVKESLLFEYSKLQIHSERDFEGQLRSQIVESGLNAKDAYYVTIGVPKLKGGIIKMPAPFISRAFKDFNPAGFLSIHTTTLDSYELLVEKGLQTIVLCTIKPNFLELEIYKK